LKAAATFGAPHCLHRLHIIISYVYAPEKPPPTPPQTDMHADIHVISVEVDALHLASSKPPPFFTKNLIILFLTHWFVTRDREVDRKKAGK
jgi:hypothetical protein